MGGRAARASQAQGLLGDLGVAGKAAGLKEGGKTRQPLLPAFCSHCQQAASGLGDSSIQEEEGGWEGAQGHPSARDVESLVNQGCCLRPLRPASACCGSRSLGAWGAAEGLLWPRSPHGDWGRRGNSRATLVEEGGPGPHSMPTASLSSGTRVCHPRSDPLTSTTFTSSCKAFSLNRFKLQYTGV